MSGHHIVNDPNRTLRKRVDDAREEFRSAAASVASLLRDNTHDGDAEDVLMRAYAKLAALDAALMLEEAR